MVMLKVKGFLWLCRRQVSQLEEGDVGTLHPVYQLTCQPWITFMAQLGKRFYQDLERNVGVHIFDDE